MKANRLHEVRVMYYDVVIFDAASVALGIASELKKKRKVLIVNRTSMVAAEFINSYKPGRNWEEEPETDLAKSIAEKLRAERLITERAAHFYAAGPVFYKAYSDLGVDLLLETEILSVEKAGSAFEITIYNCAGFGTVKTPFIIDTTDEGFCQEKSLNCLLVNKDKAAVFPAVSMQGADFFPTHDEIVNSVIMRYHCPPDASLAEARHGLIELWQGRPEVLSDWKIASIGLYFDITPRAVQEVGQTKCIIPASSYDNPLAAVDAGVKVGRRLADDL
ncbi:MAG TPA: hypothetical protein PLC26_09840 [Bacillota bacterium]|nr:hypothetical protein [Bacillota bacterium]HQD40808.1 hypothetical protein [Bacillota bacterium]